MSEVALFIEHSLVYSNHKPLPIQDVVDSLLGIKRLSSRVLPGVFQDLTGAKIKDVCVLVEGIEEGSFKESFLLQVLFTDEANMKRFQKAMRELDLRGMYSQLPLKGRPMIKVAAVSSVIAALVTYGVYSYVSGTASAEERALVTANNNIIIAIGAEAYKIDPAAFESVIVAAVARNRKEVSAAAADILAPAHREDGATVTMGDGAVISSAVVRLMPTDIVDSPYEQTQDFKNVLIDIRQSNRDSATEGWRGRIAGTVDNRVKLSLGNVGIGDLAGKLEVRADATVRYRMSEKTKELAPIEIIISEVRDDAVGGGP